MKNSTTLDNNDESETWFIGNQQPSVTSVWTETKIFLLKWKLFTQVFLKHKVRIHLWLLLLWWIQHKLNLSHLSIRPSVKAAAACGVLLCVSVINSDRKWHELSASVSRPAARRQPLAHFSARRFSLQMRGHVTRQVIKGLKKNKKTPLCLN